MLDVLLKGRRRALISLGLVAFISLSLGGIVARGALLRALGHALVAVDPVGVVDVIVVGNDGGSAGELEAADLVNSRVASRVAVFAHVLSPEDLEFMRRGLPVEDSADRSIRQLTWLGVTSIERIPIRAAGTEAEVKALSLWVEQRGIRSLVVVTSSDHSRRFRRLLARTLAADTKVAVRPSRYSKFQPDEWWRTRDGIRTEIIELQKLLLDIARHPFS